MYSFAVLKYNEPRLDSQEISMGSSTSNLLHCHTNSMSKQSSWNPIASSKKKKSAIISQAIIYPLAFKFLQAMCKHKPFESPWYLDQSSLLLHYFLSIFCPYFSVFFFFYGEEVLSQYNNITWNRRTTERKQKIFQTIHWYTISSRMSHSLQMANSPPPHLLFVWDCAVQMSTMYSNFNRVEHYLMYQADMVLI